MFLGVSKGSVLYSCTHTHPLHHFRQLHAALVLKTTSNLDLGLSSPQATLFKGNGAKIWRPGLFLSSTPHRQYQLLASRLTCHLQDRSQKGPALMDHWKPISPQVAGIWTRFTELCVALKSGPGVAENWYASFQLFHFLWPQPTFPSYLEETEETMRSSA